MSKKKKVQAAVEVKPPVQFEIDGVVYTEGDPLQIIAPELGIIIPDSSWRFHNYSKKGIVSFDLGWVKTPLSCITHKHPSSPNALMNLTCTRLEALGASPATQSNLLHLVYFCHCRHSAHNDELRWYVSFEKGIVRADSIGFNYYKQAHNHPLVEGYEHLTPLPQPVIVERPLPVEKPKPVQLQLF